MSRGHNFGGERAQAMRRNVRVRLTESLAELVAGGLSINGAGEQLGLTRGQAARMWANIKADLGSQAQ